MRRATWKGIRLVALFCVAGLFGLKLFTFARSQADAPGVRIVEETQTLSVNELDRENWITFRIPPAARRIKIISRAGMTAGGLEELLDREFLYTIEYRFESLNGEVLQQGRLDLNSTIDPKQNDLGRLTGEFLYKDVDYHVASGKVSIIDFEDNAITLVRLRAGELADPVSQVGARVFFSQAVPERKLRYLWSRLSPEDRNRLLALRVHGGAMLKESEKHALLSNRWVLIGAHGIEGRDFHCRDLFHRQGLVPLVRTPEDVLGEGERPVREGYRSIIAIPSPGRCRIETRMLDGDPPQDLVLRWYGPSIQDRREYRFDAEAARPEISLSLGPGMLEAFSAGNYVLRAWLTPDDTGSEILLAQEPLKVRAWLSDTVMPLVFDLARPSGERGLFRFRVRPLDQSPVQVNLERLDAAGTVIGSSDHEVPAETSRYDLVASGEEIRSACDPVDFVLNLPPDIAALRVSAEPAALISGYTRPAGLVHRTRVPEDYQRGLSGPDRQPVWFLLRPREADTLTRSHRSVLVHTQTRPPDDDLDVLLNRYRWERIQPVEGALGHYLFVERDPEDASREESLASLFMPLPLEREQPLQLAEPSGVDGISRRLVIIRESTEPFRVNLVIDGVSLLARTVALQRGEISLPPFPPASRSIRLQTEPAVDAEFFINYVAADRATRIKRLAERMLPGRELVYLVEKDREEMLITGYLFAAPGETQPLEVSLRIEPADGGGFREEAVRFTPRSRMYIVTPEAGERTPVLGGALAQVDGGRRMFIPLGGDLQPGSYRITMKLESGAEAYLALSQIVPGSFAGARFFREESR